MAMLSDIVNTLALLPTLTCVIVTALEPVLASKIALPVTLSPTAHKSPMSSSMVILVAPPLKSPSTTLLLLLAAPANISSPGRGIPTLPTVGETKAIKSSASGCFKTL